MPRSALILAAMFAGAIFHGCLRGAPLPSDAGTPQDLPPSGQVRWMTSCRLMNGGVGGEPVFIDGTSPDAGNPQSCTITPNGTGADIVLSAERGANQELTANSFYLRASFRSVGRSADNGGQIVIGSASFAVVGNTIVGQDPALYPCEVVLTTLDLATRSLTGKFKCAGVRNNAPGRTEICSVRGQNNFTREPDWGDFQFTHCLATVGRWTGIKATDKGR